MIKNCIVINGQFTARRMTGQERFAFEIVKELDSLVKKGEYELVVPQNAINVPCLVNIKVIHLGWIKGVLWEQICLAYYLLKEKKTSLNLCTNMALLAPGYICIHDISYKVNPHFFTTIYSRISAIWHKIQYNFAWRFSPLIFTVSKFSKEQIVNVYGVSPFKIIVIGNGWQHFDEVIEDNTIIEKYPQLKGRDYFFSLGSLSANKNIKWIIEVATRYPNYYFVITGFADIKAFRVDLSDAKYSNIIFTGYLSDGEIKYLMKNCKAFIFPSFFEGFGIPPLEAISVGAKVIISNTSCLPEIFEDSVYYIDPNNTNVDLEALLNVSVRGGHDILEKYSYKKFAEVIYRELNLIKYR